MTYLKLDPQLLIGFLQANVTVYRKDVSGPFLAVINCKRNYSIIQNQESIEFIYDCEPITEEEFNRELEIALSNLKITK